MGNNINKPESYTTALMQRGHNLAYKFPDDKYLFFRVEDYEDAPLIYSEYNVLAKQSSSATIGSATSGEDWNRWSLNNSVTYDIFMERGKNIMLQVFIGISSPDLKMWRQIPAPTPRGNLDQTKITALNDSTPGFITGEESGSPFDAPTVLSEMFVPANFPSIRFGLYNPATVPIMPKFRVIIRRMKVHTYDPRDQMDKNIINDIIGGRKPCKVYSPGLDGYQYDAEMNYGVAPMPWKVI